MQETWTFQYRRAVACLATDGIYRIDQRQINSFFVVRGLPDLFIVCQQRSLFDSACLCASSRASHGHRHRHCYRAKRKDVQPDWPLILLRVSSLSGTQAAQRPRTPRTRTESSVRSHICRLCHSNQSKASLRCIAFRCDRSITSSPASFPPTSVASSC